MYLCVFICVCFQCMYCVWVMGLSQRAKQSSPHHHNGRAQARQTLHSSQLAFLPVCLFEQRIAAGVRRRPCRAVQLYKYVCGEAQ